MQRFAIYLLIALGWASFSKADDRPNIIWIVVEDASAHLGCYGETTIQTPHLDQLSRDGVRYTRAFVTCPVCSPSRSAMVTGMYQTTLGAHNHRSQASSGKGGGTPEYFASYELPVKSIPRLFKDAGYYTCNSATGMPDSKFGKTDYNFIWNRDDYDAADWAKRTKGQPFFAQIQLRGGKKRNTRHGTDPAKVHLPPYYPDHPVMRADWASYLDSWIEVDLEVGRILKRLEDEGIADSTVIFFWTDHGVSHARGKQFLYDEGIHVPLIARFPNDANPGVTIGDLVLHIDVAATSLALAGIEQPAYVQGLNILSKEYSGRDMVFAARDRCDETVEIIRCARTKRYKYIRNFLPHLPHLQANQYKDGKQIIKTLRQLEDQGKLTPLQRTLLATPRPREELYDLEKDPHETTNLATDPRHAQTLAKMRGALYQWMIDSRDLGLIAEPILEEMGHAYGNKYQVLQHDDHRHLVRDLLRTIDGDTSRHQQSLQDSRAAVRYWGATMLGIEGDQRDIERLSELENDPSSGVRVAAALARCRLGDAGAAKWLAQAVKHENRLTGMYAIRGLELAGPLAKPYRDVILQAQKSDYEFTRRIARRLVTNQ